MHVVITEPSSSIRISEDVGSLANEDLAKALAEIWRARYSWTPEQKEKIIAMSKEPYVSHGK